MNSDSTPHTDDSTTGKESHFLLIKGFIMGSADIVPGVSGGTMALILGIYSRLIHAIKSVDLAFFKKFLGLKLRQAFNQVHWRFLSLIITGIVLAVLFFTKVVPLQFYMFTEPELIFGLFFGLILSSIFLLTREIDGFGWSHGGFILLGTIFGFWVVTLVPADTPESYLFVFMSGAVAICAMILPGISGSYILLILRKYDFILSHIGALGGVDTLQSVMVLAVFIAGAIVGLAAFSRILSWFLDNYYGATLAILIGFLLGSLYVIWPYQYRTYKEVVIRTEVVDYDDPAAVRLRNSPPDTDRPRFNRLGDVIDKDAVPYEVKKVELETVKKKLIKTQPFMPYLREKRTAPYDFWGGIIGVGIGLILVSGLDYLRMKD